METVDLRLFIPAEICSGRSGNVYTLTVLDLDNCYRVMYSRPSSNQTGRIVGQRTHQHTLPKALTLDKLTFEVLGLLQGEMSKTVRSALTFANSEPVLINLVLEWFVRESLASPSDWSWYIKLNLPLQRA